MPLRRLTVRPAEKESIERLDHLQTNVDSYEVATSDQEHTVDALAQEGDEGRDKLR